MEHLPTSPDDKESSLIREIRNAKAYEIYRSIGEDYDEDYEGEDNIYEERLYE